MSSSAEVPYVVIELDPDRAAQIRAMRDDMLVIEADATKDESLNEAHIWTARGLVPALQDEISNLFICLSAKGLRPDLEVVARATDEEGISKLLKAGADHVISPTITGGSRMAAILLQPQVVSFLDVVTGDGELTLRLEQILVSVGSPLAGVTLAEARIRNRTGLIVLGRSEQIDSLQDRPSLSKA